VQCLPHTQRTKSPSVAARRSVFGPICQTVPRSLSLPLCLTRSLAVSIALWRFLMCLGISSSSKLMTTANQTDISAVAAAGEAEVATETNPERVGNLRMARQMSSLPGLRPGFMSNIFPHSISSFSCSCSLLNYISCHGCLSRKVHQAGPAIVIKLLETRLPNRPLPYFPPLFRFCLLAFKSISLSHN